MQNQPKWRIASPKALYRISKIFAGNSEKCRFMIDITCLAQTNCLETETGVFSVAHIEFGAFTLAVFKS